MSYIKHFFIVAAVTFAFHSYSQVNFEFIEDKHDFGLVDEGVNARWDFKFINKGTDTIRLQETDVRASCGCTTPYWTKEPIAPGQTGMVSAQYNSAGRPGTFNKTVTVSYNGSVVKMLTIKGIVVKPDTTKYSEADIKKSAKIALEKTAHNFGKVERGQKVLTKIVVKNIGKDTLKILNGQSACSCITYKLMMNKKDNTSYEVKDVPPGKTAFLELVYSAQGDGKNSDVITFTTNDLSTRRVAVTLSAEVVASLQDSSILMENKSNAPFGSK
ncbi:MAG: DUF1573 domain-containing protein [Cytophagaceae bacterium]|nr:DUF1573 domain-containing protein [Cytophagaceae bacterium]MDW8457100.1 DUF1573 domain-containing protein [Cytophagaceae bacterium]